MCSDPSFLTLTCTGGRRPALHLALTGRHACGIQEPPAFMRLFHSSDVLATHSAAQPIVMCYMQLHLPRVFATALCTVVRRCRCIIIAMLLGGLFRGLLGGLSRRGMRSWRSCVLPGTGNHTYSHRGLILFLAETGSSAACTVMLTAFAVPFR